MRHEISKAILGGIALFSIAIILYQDFLIENWMLIIGLVLIVLSIISFYLQTEKYKIKSAIKATITSTNLSVKREDENYYPRVVKCEEKKDGHRAKIKLLPGICGQDFQDRKQYFDSALHGETSISEKDGYVYMEVKKYN